MSHPIQGLLGPWRRSFQWLTTLTLLGIPFVRIHDVSLFRIDLVELELVVGGRSLGLEQFHLVLLFGLALVLLFLLVTLAFGRAWCGWACPQTTLTDLVEACARRLGVRVSAGKFSASRGQTLLLHLLYAGLGLLVGANLVWYFLSPYEFFPALVDGTLPAAATVTLLVVAVTVYLDLGFLRRTLCTEFCPYGRFQTVLIDPGTLTLRYHPDEVARCIQCAACVRACPTGIDIRAGEQIECINCGRCLDACRRVMVKRKQPGIIRYTFGLEGRGLRALLNLRMLLVGSAFVAITGVFLYQAVAREPFSVKLARAVTPARTLADGSVANFFSAYLARQNREAGTVFLRISPPARGLRLQGPTGPLTFDDATPRRRLDLAVISATPPGPGPVPVRLELVNGAGDVLTGAELFLVAPAE